MSLSDIVQAEQQYSRREFLGYVGQYVAGSLLSAGGLGMLAGCGGQASGNQQAYLPPILDSTEFTKEGISKLLLELKKEGAVKVRNDSWWLNDQKSTEIEEWFGIPPEMMEVVIIRPYAPHQHREFPNGGFFMSVRHKSSGDLLHRAAQKVATRLGEQSPQEKSNYEWNVQGVKIRLEWDEYTYFNYNVAFTSAESKKR